MKRELDSHEFTRFISEKRDEEMSYAIYGNKRITFTFNGAYRVYNYGNQIILTSSAVEAVEAYNNI